jgi:hypothetical protein
VIAARPWSPWDLARLTMTGNSVMSGSGKGTRPISLVEVGDPSGGVPPSPPMTAAAAGSEQVSEMMGDDPQV